MTRLRSLLIGFVVPADEDEGSVATEYGLTLMLIALAIIVAATAFGIAVAGLFDTGTAAFPGAGS
ncbi:MAG TPA: Flp family type IVb pilin [Actinomycetota bacterium]|jgi:Flp pilus assembly pilin Flp|nr:Flp family type IVb pilin [Actinomycetota bacterium]